MIDALGSYLLVRPKTMAKKVRGSHRSDLTTVRNCAIVRSVAIALRASKRTSELAVMQVNYGYQECK
jgi:hypothetical protein